MAEHFLKYPKQARLIRTAGASRNAPDFVLAYQVGVEAVRNPNGFFHIVSRNKGFDALVAHLQNEKVSAVRDDTFAQALGSSRAHLPTFEERMKAVVGSLTNHKNHRPKRRPALRRHIDSYFGRRLPASELDAMIAVLEKNELEINSNGRVAYKI